MDTLMPRELFHQVISRSILQRRNFRWHIKVTSPPEIMVKVDRELHYEVRSWILMGYVSLKKKVYSHIRRLPIVLINLLFNHMIFWRLLGWVNQKLGFIESVFLAYPANDDYALAYVYRQMLPKVRWKPWPVGLLKQNGKWALMFVISASNNDFRDPANRNNLSHIVQQMERFRELIHAPRKTFAGILPGVLLNQRAINKTYERDVTVMAITKAVEDVVKKGLNEETPIIVLGGCGFIGRPVCKSLTQLGYKVIPVDKKGKPGAFPWPYNLRGKSALVINITDNGILKEFVTLFWEGITVLNEVYPEPELQTKKMMKTKGCVCYHIVGVRGKAYPSFPHAYHGAIPCCSAHVDDNMKVVLSLL